MQKKIFPIILTAALLVSSLVSLFFIHNLQGNAKVINYAGVVRGATQRLIKQELNHSPNDALIGQIEGILEELQTGHGVVGMRGRDRWGSRRYRGDDRNCGNRNCGNRNCGRTQL